MTQYSFPPLSLAGWQATRDTLHRYAQVLGKIRRALTPRQKHWWHISLRATATGLTTTPVPAGSMTFEMELDLLRHRLAVDTSLGQAWHNPLRGQSATTFCAEALAMLNCLGIQPAIDRSLFESTQPGAHDVAAVERFWQALSQVDALLKRFKGELREETSPVQLWPHHFDLSLVWFSGRLVPGVDPGDEEMADEQMAFGFSTGDETIPEPYFYVTAYPLPPALPEADLPYGVVWQTEGFQGAVLRYESLVGAEAPGEMLLTYWRDLQQAGARLMT